MYTNSGLVFLLPTKPYKNAINIHHCQCLLINWANLNLKIAKICFHSFHFLSLKAIFSLLMSNRVCKSALCIRLWAYDWFYGQWNRIIKKTKRKITNSTWNILESICPLFFFYKNNIKFKRKKGFRKILEIYNVLQRMIHFRCNMNDTYKSNEAQNTQKQFCLEYNGLLFSFYLCDKMQ